MIREVEDGQMHYDRIRLLKNAIKKLHDEQTEAVRNLAIENSAENRQRFHELHETLSLLKTTLLEEESYIFRLWKRFKGPTA